MGRALVLVAALGVALMLGEAGRASPRWPRAGQESAGYTLRHRGYLLSHRVRSRRLRPFGRRTVVRPAGVSLPQLRTELSLLEDRLGGRVQRVEKAVSHLPLRRPVVVPPPPPPARAPGLPAGPAAAAALLLSALTGAVGFALGQRSAGRALTASPKNGSETSAAVGPRRKERTASPWRQICERLDETQDRLSTVRARIRQLERREV